MSIDKTKIKATLIEVIYKDIVSSQFIEIKKYIAEHYENYEDKRATLDEIIRENSENEFIDSVIDDYNAYDNFQQILYSSQVVIIFAQLEFWMSKIAKKIEQRTGSKIKLTDLNENSDLARARKYINLIGEIEFSDQQDQWKEIMDFRVIRNLIVHNAGNLFKHQIIKKDQKDFNNQEKDGLRIINSNNRLIVDIETGIIKITDLNYPLRFCSICIEFLHTLLDKIILKYS
jgi:hypothetical protein